MAEVLSVFGVQTVSEKEQLVVRYPSGRVDLINGPKVQWVQPGATVERRPAIVLSARQYCLVETYHNGDSARVEKGPQILFLHLNEFCGEVKNAPVLKKGEYVRLVDPRTGQERIEVGPNAKGVFPDPHEDVVDTVPQRAKQLRTKESAEIFNNVTSDVRIVRGPTVLYLSSAETLVDQTLLLEAEEDALEAALAASKEVHEQDSSSADAGTPGPQESSAAATLATDNVKTNKRTAEEKISPRTAVHSFLSQLFGRTREEILQIGRYHQPQRARAEATKRDLQEPGKQLQSLGRTVRYRGRPGGPTFAEVHENLLADLERQHNLQPKFVGGSGDCLFCCFLHYEGAPINAQSIKRIRNEIADAIRHVVMEDPYMGVIYASNAGSDRRNGEGMTIEQYIAGMRGRGWGDTVCIGQYCQLRQIKARLHTIMNDERVEETDFCVPGAAERPVLEIIHHPDPADGSMFHYEVLVPVSNVREQRGITLRQWREDVAKEAAKRQRKR